MNQQRDLAAFIRSQLAGLAATDLIDRRLVILGLAPQRTVSPTELEESLGLCHRLVCDGARLVIPDRPRSRIALSRLLQQRRSGEVLRGTCELVNDPGQACRGADAVLLLPGWSPERPLTWRSLAAAMRPPGWLFDLRQDADLSRPAAAGLETWHLPLLGGTAASQSLSRSWAAAHR
jgi:UDPglucose 6-dehydrogenase